MAASRCFNITKIKQCKSSRHMVHGTCICTHIYSRPLNWSSKRIIANNFCFICCLGVKFASHLSLGLLPDVRNRTQASHMLSKHPATELQAQFSWHWLTFQIPVFVLYLSLKFKKLWLCVLACMYVHVQHPCSDQGVEKKVSDPRDWSYRWVWAVVGELGGELESSEEQQTLKCWVITPSPWTRIFKGIKRV